MSLTEHDTQELPATMLPLPDSAFEPVSFQFAAATHVGLRRSTNEDHFAVVRRIRTREILLTNAKTEGFQRPQAETYALVVADGLGGAGHGDLASELILRIGWDLASAEPSWTMKFRPEQWTTLCEYVNNLAQRMQRELLSHSDADPRLAGMGTTWTCYYLMGPHAILAHVGDSRAYLLRNGTLQQMSQDHNFARQLEECGVSPEEAAPFRHILTNAFGASEGKIDVDVLHVPLQHGDRLLLCTDGLSNMVPDTEIAQTLAKIPHPQEACNRLVQQALEHGGKDNVTVILADVQFGGPLRSAAS